MTSLTACRFAPFVNRLIGSGQRSPESMDGAMITWISSAVLIISVLLCLHFYVEGAGPAPLEKEVGAIAYTKCT